MRRYLVVALLLGTFAIPADAGTKGCPFLTDPRGDVRVVPSGQGATAADSAGARPGEDILSSDVWADRTYLTAVLRVDALPSKGESGSTPDAQGIWWIWFIDTADGQLWLDADERDGHYWFHAAYGHVRHAGSDSASASAGSYEPIDGATGTVNNRAATIRVRLPLSALGVFTQVSPGTVLTHTQVTSFASVGMPSLNLPQTTQSGSANTGEERDDAQTSRHVIMGTPNCVS